MARPRISTELRQLEQVQVQVVESSRAARRAFIAAARAFAASTIRVTPQPEPAPTNGHGENGRATRYEPCPCGKQTGASDYVATMRAGQPAFLECQKCGLKRPLE